MDFDKKKLRQDREDWGCEKYALKLAAGRGARRIDGDVEAQALNYTAGLARVRQLRSDTAAVLDGFGVPGIVRPFYYDFVLSVAKRDRVLWNEAQLRAEARVLVDLWAGRGLKRDILLAVARQVLGLDLSSPDPDPCMKLE